jgi:predicted RNase H-like nuclease (RuvC/YqgF family)
MPPQNPFEEIQRQNRELMGALEDLRRKDIELAQQLAEAERLNRLFVGRELRMKELKEKIAKLEKEGGKVS